MLRLLIGEKYGVPAEVLTLAFAVACSASISVKYGRDESPKVAPEVTCGELGNYGQDTNKFITSPEMP